MWYQYRLIYISEVFASEPKDTIDYKSGRRRVFVGHVMQFNGMLLWWYDCCDIRITLSIVTRLFTQWKDVNTVDI